MNPYDKLLDEARGRPFACIVGWPVEHSRSPALHGFWLKQHKIDGHYGRLPVEPKRAALEELVAFLKRTPNARGCNLTLPHKIDIMPLLDRIDPLAAHIGAVNTVIKQADGTLEGRNSDGFGFLEALRQGAPGWQAAAGPAVVLGAGGAARAVVATLVAAGVPELCLVNRTQSSAISCTCTAALAAQGTVWGTDVYTDDSALCRAAVHAGIIPAAGGAVRVRVVPGRQSYPGSTRNGVQSQDYGAWENAFAFDK